MSEDKSRYVAKAADPIPKKPRRETPAFFLSDLQCGRCQRREVNGAVAHGQVRKNSGIESRYCPNSRTAESHHSRNRRGEEPVKACYGVIVAIWLMLGPVPAATVRAQAKTGTPERELFDDANRERSTRGLPLLRWDAELAEAARLHALRMAQQNALSHQFAGEPELAPRLRQSGAHFSAAAENVAEGPTPARIHDGWMKSPGHRENLLDPQLNSLGIAVVEGARRAFCRTGFFQVGGRAVARG
jgi:uncharacterized protein YkwD